jgi:Mrp family chromosome partitioning ATPase
MCVLIIVENMSGFVCSNFKPAHNILKTTSGENLAEGYVLPILKSFLLIHKF